MGKDKYSATWVSHSSLGDFLSCPRAYYLKNVYKDPQTKHKIQIVSPPLSLGAAVHEVLEGLSVLPLTSRFKQPLVEKFEKMWKKYNGLQGGFSDLETEQRYKERGLKMLSNIANNPGPLQNLAVKISMDLPYYWLSEEDNIILCGKIDWLEYLPDTDSVHIIDFKTGKQQEKPDSLQLPIYCLLVQNTQGRGVSQASYWYLESDTTPTSKQLPDLEETKDNLLTLAKKVKLMRLLEKFNCPENGCRYCRPYEAVLQGRGQLVGTGEYNTDLYLVSREPESKEAQLL